MLLLLFYFIKLNKSFVHYGPEGNVYKPCVDKNCMECEDDIKIRNDCKPGYALNPETHTCTKCLSNCKTCTHDRKCTQCFEGYGLELDSTGKSIGFCKK